MGGGRWNPPRVMNVVYLSRAPETAMYEANEHRRYFGLPLWEGMPKVTVAVQLDVDLMLDLTDAAISADLPEPMANLLAEDWRAVMERGEEPTTQAMGRAALKAGLKGLIVPSKPHPKGVNLIVFPDALEGANVLEVLNPKELKKLGKRA
jgi:RES domain-containing protein